MGAYLSEPVTEKISQDGTSERLSFGASSMQGWRRTQEDAHNCLADFDKDTSCFAVYDGHGGDEVAKYCSLHLPDFIRSLPEYAIGNIAKALEDAFLEFDATLTKPEVIAELKQLAGHTDVSDSDKEDTDVLTQEAKMPLEELLSRYQGGAVPMKIAPHLRNFYNEKPKSPMLRAKKDNTRDDSYLGENEDEIDRDSNDVNEEREESLDGPCDSGKAQKDERLLNGDDVWDSDKELACDSTTDIKSNASHAHNTSKKNEAVVSSCDIEVQKKRREDSRHDRGDATEKNDSVQENAISESSCIPDNGNCIDDKVACSSQETETSVDSSTKKNIPNRNNTDSSDSSDEDYGESDSDDNDKEEDEDDDDDDEDDYCRDKGVLVVDKEEPGIDSGCTAVVALLRGNQLYVANAGDSRCVVSRDGKALEMSIDHKPEDEIEKLRIEKAGGDVTQDGRVNGGLNLSRAIGDHSYKMTKNLSAQEQMITALPEIREHTVDSNDEFMVIACDGIWNYMSSQEVIDYIKEKMTLDRTKLSSICEELFDHCLAPSTKGDGTGCDNMTCIIVKFNHNDSLNTNNKRSVEDTGTSDVSGEKRIKLDDNPVL